MYQATPKELIRLIVWKYRAIRPASPFNDKDRPSAIFVGDVHGDLNQFLLPLLDSGSITLTGEIEVIDGAFPEDTLYIPKFTAHETKTNVYYLGDMVDKWIFTRTIAVMLERVLKACPNVKFCFGNHDIIRLQSLTDEVLKKHIWWCVPDLYKELAYSTNITMKRVNKYKESTEMFEKFARAYFSPVFKAFKEIVKLDNAQVLFEHATPKAKYICSHTYTCADALTEIGLPETCRNIDEINKRFKELVATNDKLISGKCKLFWNRDKEPIFDNCVVGHTPGATLETINRGPIHFYEDRKQKCLPQKLGNKNVYYFDLAASAGMQAGDISAPDYFYLTTPSKGFQVTNYGPSWMGWDERQRGSGLISFRSKNGMDGYIVDGEVFDDGNEMIYKRCLAPYAPTENDAILNRLTLSATHMDTYAPINLHLRDPKKYDEIVKKFKDVTETVFNTDAVKLNAIVDTTSDGLERRYLRCKLRGIDPLVDLKILQKWIADRQTLVPILYRGEKTDRCDNAKVGDVIDFTGLVSSTIDRSYAQKFMSEPASLGKGAVNHKVLFIIHNAKAAKLRNPFDSTTVYRKFTRRGDTHNTFLWDEIEHEDKADEWIMDASTPLKFKVTKLLREGEILVLDVE